MCGLIGSVAPPGAVDQGRWAQAQRVQAHRGPDDRGECRLALPQGGLELKLAHQRLSILDLSPAGHQPMGDPAREGVLVFNGEIYNYLELRRELESAGRAAGSSGDTQVLLHALAHWGPETTVRRLNGMWAFAWLEPGGRRLWLSRDRAGEKPLYWTQDRGGLYFASEVKTLLTLLGRRFPLDTQAIGRYLIQSVADSGRGSLFAGIEQLPAASLAVVELDGGQPVPRARSYWEPSLTEEGVCPESTRIDELRETFLDSVRLRLRADVPVGILLSGGLDSSAIAAAAARLVDPQAELNLLSLVSADPRFDESPHIRRVAAALGRPVHTVSLDADIGSQSLFAELEDAIWYNDAPVGSLSNLAHRRLMALARERGATVVLSGQGADELLCGYKKYLGFYLQSLVRGGRRLEALRVAWQFWHNGTVIGQFRLAEAKRYLPAWLKPPERDIRGPALADFRPLVLGLPAGADLRARQGADIRTLSIPSLTHFEDRMSMSVGREVRLPFLDPRLMDLLVAAPPEQKLKAGWTKHLLRRAVEPWLPPEIVWRKDKQGFANPESEWLKGGLLDGVQRCFAPDALMFKYGLVEREALLANYREYQAQGVGTGRIWFRDIMGPLALEIWLRRFEPFVAAP
jgi:asparagine synthase (glutamine-hydrolysing)